MIDNTALISQKAKLGNNVTIGPFAIIEEGVEIGDDCTISSHAIIRAGSVLGKKVFVDSFAVIGGLPQSIGFDPKIQSSVIVGDGTIIREGMTIHRSMYNHGITKVGKNCFLMANSHIAHDCILGDSVILANGVLLGGHVTVGNHTFIGGNAVLHQHLRIGEGAIIAGGARLNCDIPPFLIVTETSNVHGLNLVGIKRRGFGQEEISDLKNCFRAILQTEGSAYELAAAAKKEGLAKTDPGRTFLAFFETKGKKPCVNYRHLGKE